MLAFVTRSFQWPARGSRCRIARRLALLDWARDAGAWLVEDDYNGEYRYDKPRRSGDAGAHEHGPRALSTRHDFRTGVHRLSVFVYLNPARPSLSCRFRSRGSPASARTCTRRWSGRTGRPAYFSRAGILFAAQSDHPLALPSSPTVKQRFLALGPAQRACRARTVYAAPARIM